MKRNAISENMFFAKWGKDVLAYGYLQTPNIILQDLAYFDLSCNEGFVILNIMSRPEKALVSAFIIANDLGISVHTVRNCFRELVAKKYLHRIYHVGDANSFTYAGMTQAVKEYAKNGQVYIQKLDIGMPTISRNSSQILDTNKEVNNKDEKEEGYDKFVSIGEILRLKRDHLNKPKDI